MFLHAFLLHSCQWPCASASCVPGLHTPSWPCGLLSETPHWFLPMHSPSPPCSPKRPPSTTPWSTCCVSPISASVSTETRPCCDRGSTGEVHSRSRKHVPDRPRSATRTWASPCTSQMDSRRATGRVMWQHPNGRPASWMNPQTERWQLASSDRPQADSSSRTTWGEVLRKTEGILGLENNTTKGLHELKWVSTGRIG